MEHEVRALLQGAKIVAVMEVMHPTEGDRLQLMLNNGHSVQIAADGRLRLTAVKIA